ncbi:MAG: cation:proton antiporter [Candidatus Rhabdochlamydia sp.]
MHKIFIYSLLLIIGITVSQTAHLAPYRSYLHFFTLTLLAYIMIEVGTEFDLNKKNLKSYGKDYLIAMTAAAFPWIFCSAYFFLFFDLTLQQSALIGRFAAPTSTGLLFAMLMAAGLAGTWVFKKVRILAIFDDLDTVLFIVPLQLIYIGLQFQIIFILLITILLLIVAYRYLHRVSLPTNKLCIFIYALLLTGLVEFLKAVDVLDLEILLPAFVLGCVLKAPHKKIEQPIAIKFDNSLKFIYMFLVGCSLAKISFGHISWVTLSLHVLMLTFLANLGKLFPMFCYKKEVSLRERTALSVAMWPRGEVGAGVLMISTQYQLPPIALELAGLSLTLNLALSGAFIYLVIWLMKKPLKRT